jgi:dTMP kinase
VPGPYFIALEGIDGSGTTSQCRLLSTSLADRGHTVLETREPSTGVIGRLIRQHLAVDADAFDPAALALLFAADRLDHLAREVEPALERGEIVVCDRYVLSSWAYQSLDMPLAWVKEINERARWPDLTLFVDVDAEIAGRRVEERLARGESTPELFEVPDTQRRLARAYSELALDPSLTGVVHIDGNQPLEAVSRDIAEAVHQAGV